MQYIRSTSHELMQIQPTNESEFSDLRVFILICDAFIFQRGKQRRYQLRFAADNTGQGDRINTAGLLERNLHQFSSIVSDKQQLKCLR